MKSRCYTKITSSKVENVLNYFYNNNDNRTSVIAKNLNVPLSHVNYILDIHLKYKKNAYISEIIYEGGNVPKMKLKVYEDKLLIGEFKSYYDAEKKLKIPMSSIARYLQFDGETTINHYKIKKRYTYIKIA